MARATSSLPVPFSPVISTRPVDGAVLAILSKIALHARRPCRSSRSRRALGRAAARARARSRASSSAFCDGDQQLVAWTAASREVVGAEPWSPGRRSRSSRCPTSSRPAVSGLSSRSALAAPRGRHRRASSRRAARRSNALLASFSSAERPAPGDLDAVALELERAADRGQDVRLVVDDEQRGHLPIIRRRRRKLLLALGGRMGRCGMRAAILLFGAVSRRWRGAGGCGRSALALLVGAAAVQPGQVDRGAARVPGGLGAVGGSRSCSSTWRNAIATSATSTPRASSTTASSSARRSRRYAAVSSGSWRGSIARTPKRRRRPSSSPRRPSSRRRRRARTRDGPPCCSAPRVG